MEVQKASRASAGAEIIAGDGEHGVDVVAVASFEIIAASRGLATASPNG